MLLYMYTLNALLKDAFSDQVRMLDTVTDLFYLHFFVEDFANKLWRALNSEAPSTLAKSVLSTILISIRWRRHSR